MHMTVTLSESDVKELLRVALTNKLGKRVINISINVEMQYEDRPNGGQHPMFKDVTVQVEA